MYVVVFRYASKNGKRGKISTETFYALEDAQAFMKSHIVLFVLVNGERVTI